MNNPYQPPQNASVSQEGQPADAQLAKRLCLAVVCCAVASVTLLVFGSYQSLTYYYAKPHPVYLLACYLLVPVLALAAEVLGGVYFVKAWHLPDNEERVWMGVAVWVSMIVAAIPLGILLFSLATAFLYVPSAAPTIVGP